MQVSSFHFERVKARVSGTVHHDDDPMGVRYLGMGIRMNGPRLGKERVSQIKVLWEVSKKSRGLHAPMCVFQWVDAWFEYHGENERSSSAFVISGGLVVVVATEKITRGCRSRV